MAESDTWGGKVRDEGYAKEAEDHFRRLVAKLGKEGWEPIVSDTATDASAHHFKAHQQRWYFKRPDDWYA